MAALDPSARRWRLTVQSVAAVPAAIGALNLLGWLTGWTPLRGWTAANDVMPPDAGFLFVAAGGALIAVWGRRAWRRNAVTLFAVLALLLCGASLLRSFAGAQIVPLLPEGPGEPMQTSANPHMGVLATVSFLITNAGLLMLVIPSVHRRLIEAAAGACGVIVATFGLAHTLGYLYGRPLRFETQGLPISLNAAVAFIALGGALALTPAIRDLEARLLERRRQAAQYLATRTLVESDTVQHGGERLLKELCEQLGWTHGVLWTRDATRGLLRCVAAWSAPDVPGLEKLTALSRSGAFARGIGLPGRAWAAREIVAIENAAQDSEFARKAAAQNAGLYGGFAAPVSGEGEDVLGVLEFLHPQVEAPSAATRTLIEAVASQTALYIRRKQAEQALGDEHNRLRAVIDNLPDPLFLKDTTGHYVLDNTAHLRSLGMTSTSQIIGKTAHDLFPPEEADRFQTDDDFVVSTGQPIFDREEYRLDVSGNPQWVSSSKVPFRDESGKLIGLICVSRDITERKTAEEALQAAQMQLIQAEKLESLGRLAAGIAHEVKNPLALILMAADFLDAELADQNVAAAVPEVIGQIRDAAWRADGIIRGMLDFAAPNKMDAQSANLNDLLRKTLPLVRHEMEAAAVALETQLAEDLPPVSLDINKIQQVFINVCTNAVHAMPGGGALTVRTCIRRLEGADTSSRDAGSRINERLRPGDDVIAIEIEDTGSGVPPEKLAYIFEPFYTTKPAGKGTGLGLSVTRKIIELHGGEIRIGNRAEGGARVTILLRPLAPESIAAPDAGEVTAEANAA